jgi:hypothetical protein
MHAARLFILRSGFALLLLTAPMSGSLTAAPQEVGRGCPPERAQNGEVRLVFLADSGYGQGFSEWGAHGQEAIAARLGRLRLPPDLVFFLGDNVYWRGSADLYKPRFDDMYDALIRECKAHVALGNHDIKDCRAALEREPAESCLQGLRDALVADRKARYLRQGLDEEAATSRAETETDAETKGELAAKALSARKANCLPGDATAYKDVRPGQTCNAEAALAHAQFGFGNVEAGNPPASQRQRYYSVLWPLPRLAPAGEPGEGGAGRSSRPLVEVIVLDSNTLEVEGGMLEKQEGQSREDKLQLLWLRNAMRQWVPARTEEHGIWKLLAMHHPPNTPDACVCRVLGKCLGGHADERGLRDQIKTALEDLEPPDLVLTAHNHLYARSHPLDLAGARATGDKGGVRYFVTGGGGAPLYVPKAKDARFAKTISTYHFLYLRLNAASAFFWMIDAHGKVRDSGCFEKGSNVDHPLSPDFNYFDALPPRCVLEGKP